MTAMGSPRQQACPSWRLLIFAAVNGRRSQHRRTRVVSGAIGKIQLNAPAMYTVGGI
jgi:hypothetical protein